MQMKVKRKNMQMVIKSSSKVPQLIAVIGGTDSGVYATSLRTELMSDDDELKAKICK
jgi:hypothetical protein